MSSGDSTATKGIIVEETPSTEGVSLTIPLEPSAETAKINIGQCDDFEPNDLGPCVVKELVCTTATTPSTTSQLLSPSEGIGTITQNFDQSSSTTPDPLLD